MHGSPVHPAGVGPRRETSNEPGMSAQESASLDVGAALFDGFPVPLCLVDPAGRLMAMNRRAIAYLNVDPDTVLGKPAMRALGIVPSDGGDAWARLSPPGARPRLPCRITAGNGPVRPATVIYTALDSTAPQLGALFIIDEATAQALSDLPTWALRDPVTGLGNRHLWALEVPKWAACAGCVAFFDLDDLKEVNDLHGHVAGDRTLAAVGQALSAVAPPESLTVRYGGDEFVVVLPEPDEAAAEAWAESAVGYVASSAASAGLPIVPRLSHGVAAFWPGGLIPAVQRADDVLYERKGVLLPGSNGGRIILTREGRTALRGPGDDRRQDVLGAVQRFGPDFDACFRTIYAHSVAQAEGFIRFVAPRAGDAVVEVGAGAGRITFDGGLAECVGPTGQLLVTDPSGIQLQQARRRAAALGLDWVRFLRARAEDLPLASDTADLVLGSTFLHFTEPVRTLREMARVLRPGGRVAVSAPLALPWSALMQDSLSPVWETLARHGLGPRHFLLTGEELLAALAEAGLHVERHATVGPEEIVLPNADTALAVWRQVGLVPLLLRDVAVQWHDAVQTAFEERLRSAFQHASPAERTRSLAWMHVAAVRSA